MRTIFLSLCLLSLAVLVLAASNQSQPTTQRDYVTMARQDAASAGISADLFVRQINQESGFNPRALSPAGAIGIAQFMPGTARGLGIDPWNPIQALQGAAGLMRRYLDRFGSYARALGAYNCGSGCMGSLISRYGDYWLRHAPTQMQNYVAVICNGSC